jgi:hypothetical protein
MSKPKPAENNALYRLVFFPANGCIVDAFHPNQLIQRRGNYLIARRARLRPVIEDAFLRIERPFTRLIQIIDPVFQNKRSTHTVGGRNRQPGPFFLRVDRGDTQVIDQPRPRGLANQLQILQVFTGLQHIARIGKFQPMLQLARIHASGRIHVHTNLFRLRPRQKRTAIVETMEEGIALCPRDFRHPDLAALQIRLLTVFDDTTAADQGTRALSRTVARHRALRRRILQPECQ